MQYDLLLVSTCGTSLITNDAPPDLRRWFTDIANTPSLADADAQRLDAHVAERRERLLSADAAERRRMSAELNGIDSVLRRWPARRVQHLLIHTDTATGRATAEAVRDLLVRDGHNVQLLSAAGLRTDDPSAFREALAEITGHIEDWVPGHRDGGWYAVFNLTGGFKSINAYLQALGMLHADRCVFLFEGAPALMEIPRLPVRLAEADEVRAHLTIFRRLALGFPVSADDVAGVPDALLLIEGGQVTTSVWGDVVWRRVRKTLLGDQLLAPLSTRLVVREGVRRAFDTLAPERRVLVNEALDALAAHLDSVRSLLRSNQLKTLQGNPAPPATHELYVWSDGSAWRLFGHFEEGCFIADSLGPHLRP